MNRRHFIATLGLTATGAAAYSTTMPSKNPYYSGPISPHFDGLRFGLPDTVADKGRLDLLKWQFAGGKARWPSAFPAPGSDRPPQRVDGGALRVSYIGHASFLVQTEGLNILIDPVWSERASPFQWAGPKRVNDPGILLADLPPIDVILLSHNHYDHLDLATLSALTRGHRARIVTPLGNDTILVGHDSSIRVEAHDWEARVRLSERAAVHVEPAYHWSARGLGDRRMALWCAFVIETPAGNIYCVCDTGYRDGAIFRAMKLKHGGFRLALLPIGAYAPRWFMADQHIDPAEAVQIMQDTGSAAAIAHHWGTFQLTDEAIDEPPRRLAEALAAAGRPPESFAVLRPGGVWQG